MDRNRKSDRDAAGGAAPDRNAGKILAIDYGRVRIGLAVAGGEARIAQPLRGLARKNRNADMKRLREIVREHGVRQIVVGMPLRLDGTRGEMADEAGRFAERIRKQIGVPVALVDERLTSWEAGMILEGETPAHGIAVSAKNRRAARKAGVDSVAAALILREYLAGATAHVKGASAPGAGAKSAAGEGA